MRRLVLFIGVIVFATACTSSTPATTAPPTTTTTTVDPAVGQYEADVALIHDLWWGERLAFQQGFEEGIDYWVENNYPTMGCTFDDYMAIRYPDGPVEGLIVERVANGPTITPDDGWAIPGGRLRGQVAEGRVYVMSVDVTSSDPQTVPEPPVRKDVHVTILDGMAHFFFGCSP